MFESEIDANDSIDFSAFLYYETLIDLVSKISSLVYLSSQYEPIDSSMQMMAPVFIRFLFVFLSSECQKALINSIALISKVSFNFIVQLLQINRRIISHDCQHSTQSFVTIKQVNLNQLR